jgi:hypothetical protein
VRCSIILAKRVGLRARAFHAMQVRGEEAKLAQLMLLLLLELFHALRVLFLGVARELGYL